MKINRNSWHYILVSELISDWPRRDLCGYMRQVCLGVFVAASFISGAMVIAVMLASPVVYVALGSPELESGTYRSLVGLGVLSYIAILVVYLFKGLGEACNALGRKLSNRPRKPPKPDSLFKAWAKAKKQKFCPAIEFEG